MAAAGASALALALAGRDDEKKNGPSRQPQVFQKRWGRHFAHTKEQKNVVSHVVHSTLAFYFNSLFFF